MRGAAGAGDISLRPGTRSHGAQQVSMGTWGHPGDIWLLSPRRMSPRPHRGWRKLGLSRSYPKSGPDNAAEAQRPHGPVRLARAEMGLAVVNSHPRETQTHSLWVNASRPRFWAVLNQIISDGDLCRTAAQCLGGALLTVQGFLRQRWFRADYYERLPRARVICKAVRT